MPRSKNSKERVLKPKHVSDGFPEDAENLLNDFTNMNSTEFSDFAEVWKKHHFSLIFMGRPDHIENTEFTNEMYKISILHLSSTSFYKKIGAIYLLYALFRNQISDPPIKIRIDMNQWRIIKTIHLDADSQNLKSLHYVISYLRENAFIFLACNTLKGPLTTLPVFSKSVDTVLSLKTTYKSDILNFCDTNVLHQLRDIHVAYSEAKKHLDSDVKVHQTSSSKAYEEFIQNLDEIVNPAPLPKANQMDCVGHRRARLKNISFTNTAKVRRGKCVPVESASDTDVDTNKITKKAKIIRTRRRLPQNERRVGRPSKKPKKVEEEHESESDEEPDIGYLLSQHDQFFLPPDRGAETKKNKLRREPYYKLSPRVPIDYVEGTHTVEADEQADVL